MQEEPRCGVTSLCTTSAGVTALIQSGGQSHQDLTCLPSPSLPCKVVLQETNQ